MLAPATRRPEKCVNMHFFYPPLVMRLVEVVKGQATSEETLEVTAGRRRVIAMRDGMMVRVVEADVPAGGAVTVTLDPPLPGLRKLEPPPVAPAAPPPTAPAPTPSSGRARWWIIGGAVGGGAVVAGAVLLGVLLGVSRPADPIRGNVPPGVGAVPE